MALADQAALGPLHLYRAAGYLDLHALGDRNGRPAYSRHREISPRRRDRATAQLPHITDDLSTNPEPPGLAVRHYPTGGGQDDDSHPAPHPRALGPASVQPQ